jgi:imidazolonepropionase-like amidohydrolase
MLEVHEMNVIPCKICAMFAASIAIVGTAGCDRPAAPPAAETMAVPPLTLTKTPYKPDSGTIAIGCGTLIDGVSDEPLHNVTVRIKDGHVESVAPGLEPSKDLPWLDLKAYTCLPGLIDMHTHVTENSGDAADMSTYLRRTPEQQTALSSKQAGDTLLAGFTTIRNLGNYLGWTDRDLRDAINRGEVAGPRMQVVGYYLTIRRGGGDLIVPGVADKDIPAQFHRGVSRGADQFRAHAQAAVDGGADLLKIIASGAVLAYGGIPGAPEMTPEEISAVVQVAHAAHLKVAAHAHGAQSIKDAILAGADTIEHASLINDEDIQLAKQHGVALSMDVYNGDYIDTEGRKQKWPDEFLRKNVETTEAQRQGFTKAHAAGVAIVYGTDAGVYPHGLNARQFPIMVQRGMTPMEAIKAATSLSARYLGWDDKVGQLTPGRFGDLIAVKGDPLADITRLQDVAVVVKGGLVFKKP